MGFSNIDITIPEPNDTQQQPVMPNIFNLTTDQAQLFYYITLFSVLALATVFLIPLTFLVIVQTQNFMFNQTTNKRFSKFKRVTANDQALASVRGMRESKDLNETGKD